VCRLEVMNKVLSLVTLLYVIDVIVIARTLTLTMRMENQ